eukprot:TRINITY_DN7368_c0_g4_i1.p1 TRINITY_DN7368_c0_g4~~TRINITY_DN7368_c0_g4_i1.p1  ORF type:complete len:267 (+),score=135.49 TRINITY_DN7368_c0_g4_i1:120-920(+)
MGRSMAHLTKGRMKRPALQKGHFTKNGRKMRVQKEKAPSRFISNADKGDDVYNKVRPKGAARGLCHDEDDDADEAEAKREAVRQEQAAAAAAAAVHGNRKERRERVVEEEWEARRAAAMKGWEWYYTGLEAEKRLGSAEREALEDRRAGRQGGWMKYNYLKTHDSWAATKARRRRERDVLSEYGIDLLADARKADAFAESDGEDEEEEEEEYEEVEEDEEGEEAGGGPAEVAYPCALPVRENWVEVVPYWERQQWPQHDEWGGGDA